MSDSNQNRKYDIIVIGAGPTGSTAAKALSEKGYDVLLAEKFRMPRYKSCSGVLIKKSMELVKKYFGEEIPLSVTCTPIDNRGMIFTTDKGKEYRFEQEGLNVWRSSFDNWLAQGAVSSGAELRDNTSVISCEESSDKVIVTMQGEKIYTAEADYVIDCEGVVGSVKRKLLRQEQDYITTYQTFNHGSIELDLHYFYAYLQPELSGYDAWFNVKDDKLVLGVAAENRAALPEYYDCFIKYMKDNHSLNITDQLKEEKWLMPKIKPGCHVDFGKGRVFFAGEAAGFLNPMGEGISAGMESGHAVASAICKHFGNTELIYSEYKKLASQIWVYMSRQWDFVGNMADTFSNMKLSVK